MRPLDGDRRSRWFGHEDSTRLAGLCQGNRWRGAYRILGGPTGAKAKVSYLRFINARLPPCYATKRRTRGSPGRERGGNRASPQIRYAPSVERRPVEPLAREFERQRGPEIGCWEVPGRGCVFRGKPTTYSDVRRPAFRQLSTTPSLGVAEEPQAPGEERRKPRPERLSGPGSPARRRDRRCERGEEEGGRPGGTARLGLDWGVCIIGAALCTDPTFPGATDSHTTACGKEKAGAPVGRRGERRWSRGGREERAGTQTHLPGVNYTLAISEGQFFSLPRGACGSETPLSHRCSRRR